SYQAAGRMATATGGTAALTNALNGTFAIVTVPTPTTFTYTVPAGLASATGGTVDPATTTALVSTITEAPTATITTATESGTTVTITTSTAHVFGAGQSVSITGSSVAGYNGTFTILAVPSVTTFTYTAAAGLASATGGRVTAVGGTTAWVTTKAAHGFTVGQSVFLQGGLQ